jgi:hypothetical protein
MPFTPIPSLVFGLRHTVNQTQLFSGIRGGPDTPAIDVRQGGDLGAPSGQGYTWFNIRDDITDALGILRGQFPLPPGLVLAFKHSVNQPERITAFGQDPVIDAGVLPGFTLQNGGDLDGSAGQGFYWYESTGDGFSDFAHLNDILPRWTVIGLKHTINQSSKRLIWNGQTFDPGDARQAPPDGFERAAGGDIGAPAGQRLLLVREN